MQHCLHRLDSGRQALEGPQHRLTQAALDMDLVASAAMRHERLLSPCRPKADWIGVLALPPAFLPVHHGASTRDRPRPKEVISPGNTYQRGRGRPRPTGALIS